MTREQRRHQLIEVSRGLFAERGMSVSVDEIAAAAGVTKPVIYEHFGGKEGLYLVVVEQEAAHLESVIRAALTMPNVGYRALIELGVYALLDYLDENPDGFRILNHDSGAGEFTSVLNEVTKNVTELLSQPLTQRGFEARLAGPMAQSLVGIVAMAAQIWVDDRSLTKDELAAWLVNLAWNGLSRLEADPALITRDAGRPGESSPTGEH